MASLTIDMALQLKKCSHVAQVPRDPQVLKPPPFLSRPHKSTSAAALLEVYVFCTTKRVGPRRCCGARRRCAHASTRGAWLAEPARWSLDKCKGGTSFGFRSGPASAVSPDMSIC